MSVLSLAIVTNIALACHAGPDVDRVVAHIKVESDFDPYVINDNTDHRPGLHSATAQEAIALANRLLVAGHSIDAGLMQINSANWRRFGLTADTVFSPVANVCTGVAIINEARAREHRISCLYNTGKPDCPSDYPEKIDRALGIGSTPKPADAAAPQSRKTNPASTVAATVFWRPRHSEPQP